MNHKELRNTLEALLETDPDGLERDDLAALVGSARRLRGWLDGYDLRCVRQSRRLADAGRAESATSMFSRNGQLSSKETAKLTDRENVGEAMGSFEGALGEGAVSAGHLDAIAAATKPLDDDSRSRFAEHETALLAKAASENVDTFARRCRRLSRQLAAESERSDADELDRQRKQSSVKRWVDQVTGMHHTHLELDPIRDAALWSVVDAEIATLRQTDGNSRTPWSQLQVDAFINAIGTGAGRCSDASASSGLAKRVPEITLLIDWRTLHAGVHDNSICETENGVELPISTVRRMCCDCEVLPAVLGGKGEVLDLGRTKRTASSGQRRALRAMHRTCAHPDCTIGFSACRIHHIHWWWKHSGPTDMANLLPLCEKHHHLVHEGGWGLNMTPTRSVTWIRPDGVVAFTTASVDRADEGIGPPPESAAILSGHQLASL